MKLIPETNLGPKATEPKGWREQAPTMKVTFQYPTGSNENMWLSSVKPQEVADALTYLDGLGRQSESVVSSLKRAVSAKLASYQ